MKNPELLVKVNANAKDFKKKLEDVKKQTEDLSEKLGKVGTVAGLSFAGLTAVAVKTVNEFKNATIVTNRLETALKNQGIYTKELADDYQRMAKEIQNLVAVDDKAIVKGQALMQTFLGQEKITKELMQATVDFAQANKIDLEQAFSVVGKAIGTKVNPLAKQYGIELSNSLTVAEKMAIVTNDLNAKFGGQAQAVGEVNLPMERLNIALGDLQESIGEKLQPSIDGFIDSMASSLKWLTENETAMKALAGLIATGIGFAGLATVVIGVSQAFIALNATAIALGVTLTALTGGLFAVVAGAGALIALLANAKQKPKTIEEATKAVEDLEKKIADIKRRDPNGLALNRDLYQTQEQLKKAKKELEGLVAEKNKLETSSKAIAGGIGVNPTIEALRKEGELREKLEKERVEKEKQQIADRKKLAEELIDIGKTEMEKLDEQRKRRLEIAKGDADLRLKIEKDYQDKKLSLEKEAHENLIELRKAQGEYEKMLREKQIQEINNGASNPLALTSMGGMNADERRNTTLGAMAGGANAVVGGADGAKGLVSGLASTAVDMMIPGLGSAMKPLLDAFTQGPDAVKEMVRGFVDAIPDVVAGFIESIPVFIEEIANGIPKIIDAFIDKIPDIVTALVQALPKVIQALVSVGPKLMQSLIQAVPNLIGEFIKGLVRGAGHFVNAMINAINPFSSDGFLGGIFGFAEGGQYFAKSVPSGFPNDSYPAMLQSGELVVDQSTAIGLKEMVDGNEAGASATTSDAILLSILEELQKPIAVVDAQVEMGMDKMAQIMLTLSRLKARMS